MIYLDNSATTPLAPEVIERMNRWRAESFANASSAHRPGQRARVAIEDARERIAATIGAEPKELIFTSGGTEADNLALKGYAIDVFRKSGAWPAILTAPTEHHAVLHSAEFLERLGAPVVLIDVDAEGRVSPEALAEKLRAIADRPAQRTLVSLMHANNETGSVNPIAELAATAHRFGAIFHTDAVQSFGKLHVHADLGADMITLSAHKIHGPKGIGALYVNKEIELEPLMHGGAQERNRRGGTEAPELIVGFEEAAALATTGREETMAAIAQLSARLRARLAEIAGVRFVTPAHGALANIVNVTFDDADALDGEALIVGMDLEGVAVSNGSACTSGSLQPSHVLSAMGLGAAQARAAVRLSLSRYSSAADVEFAAEALDRVVRRMR